jgi:DNA-binding MarR family transcriptional regulator
VVLTDVGRTTLRKATVAASEAERRLLGSLSDDESAMLRKALQAIGFPG